MRSPDQDTPLPTDTGTATGTGRLIAPLCVAVIAALCLTSTSPLANAAIDIPGTTASSAANTAADDAADAEADADANNADADAAKGDKAKKDQTNASGLPTLEKLTEGMEEVRPTGGEKGLFTLYRYPDTERKEDTTKLLARIPAALLERDLLVALSVSRGQLAGWQWGDALVRFRLQGRKLIMESPDVRYVAEGDSPIVESIRRTYRPTIIAAVPILTMAGGDPVIDLAEIVTDKPGRVPGSAGSPDRSLSAYHKIKVFPENVLVDVDLAVRERDGTRMIGVSYAFRKLPKDNGFKPRVADERIGYFLEARQNWTLPNDAKETVQRYIQRWDLRKADPSLELSPPKQPIVFYIEKTTPVRWRHWVRQGVLEWNKAFEPLGFVNAIEVRQQTDDNEFADFDPEDARYNFIRWIIRGSPFGMGPRRSDPRTGQVLDADIIIDDTFLRAYQYDIERLVLGQQPVEEAMSLYERYPQFAPRWMDPPPGDGTDHHAAAHAAAHGDGAVGGVALDALPTLARNIALLDGRSAAADGADHAGHAHAPGERCEMSAGYAGQLAMAHMALAGAQAAADAPSQAGGVEIPDRLLGQIIAGIVTHEVGHALGLRHNFKASAWLPLDEIKARRDHSDEPSIASVMDYAPLVIFKGDKIDELRNIVSDPTIGPYDRWAIEYGYREPDGQSEAEMLRDIARRNTEPALAYATDEDTGWINTPDPLVSRWDLSSDLLAWSRSRVELTDELLADLRDWALDKDDPTYYLRSMFNTLVGERSRGFRQAAVIVSGQNMTRNRLSDPGAEPAFTLNDPEEQREALKLLGETIFSEDFFDFDPDLYNDLGPIRWKDWATRPVSRLDYPVHKMYTTMQSPVLGALIVPPVLQRVYDAELKTDDADKFTAAELLTSTRDMIWSELDELIDGRRKGPFTEADPMVRSIRRNLQNDHLDMLLAYAEPGRLYYVSSDLHRMVRFATRELSGKIGKALAMDADLDFASHAHLYEAKSRIDRFLEAEYQAR